MHVAVEASRLRREVRGIGRYVRALLPRLLEESPGLRLTLYPRLLDVRAVESYVASDPRTRGRVAVLPAPLLRVARADVAWYPWNVAFPLPGRGGIAVSMHDVAPLVSANARVGTRGHRRWLHRYHCTAERADVFIMNSDFTAAEAHRVLGVPRERMRVALLAADDLPLEPPDPARDADALDRLGIRPPFVLAVGADEPRKNFALLERAMATVAGQHPEATLVIVGARAARTGEGAPAWRRTLGVVSDPDLLALYRGATCFVMPSTYEGFGLPVLEAMRHGTPVVCARSSSLPEVAGDAAVWFDPADEHALALALQAVLSDDALRARLRAAGIARAARFSWRDTARATLDAFEEVASAAR